MWAALAAQRISSIVIARVAAPIAQRALKRNLVRKTKSEVIFYAAAEKEDRGWSSTSGLIDPECLCVSSVPDFAVTSESSLQCRMLRRQFSHL